ncbi:hypothetical protein, partial [Klebsiella variicola]|uniref:hypothetical protein n=1 Tax=Klebsiella variicola TaxID=244366 RepID=UPI002730CD6B
PGPHTTAGKAGHTYKKPDGETAQRCRDSRKQAKLAAQAGHTQPTQNPSLHTTGERESFRAHAILHRFRISGE